MASKSSFSKALKRLRSGRAPIITPLPALQFDMPDQDSGVDYEQKPEPLTFEVTSGGISFIRTTNIGAPSLITSVPPRAGNDDTRIF